MKVQRTGRNYGIWLAVTQSGNGEREKYFVGGIAEHREQNREQTLHVGENLQSKTNQNGNFKNHNSQTGFGHTGFLPNRTFYLGASN